MIRFLLESVIDNSKIRFDDLAVKKPNANLAAGKWKLVRNLLATALEPSPKIGYGWCAGLGYDRGVPNGGGKKEQTAKV